MSDQYYSESTNEIKTLCITTGARQMQELSKHHFLRTLLSWKSLVTFKILNRNTFKVVSNPAWKTVSRNFLEYVEIFVPKNRICLNFHLNRAKVKWIKWKRNLDNALLLTAQSYHVHLEINLSSKSFTLCKHLYGCNNGNSKLSRFQTKHFNIFVKYLKFLISGK